MDKKNNQSERLVEAFIFASAEPVHENILKRLIPEGESLQLVLVSLQGYYAGRGVHLNKAGNSWSFKTARDISQLLNKEVEKSRTPSRAATEILAIIAYHQPVTRAEIEEIRGVGLSKGTLDFLFEVGWVSPKGRRQTPGRPMTWGTTDQFLDYFGLVNIGDLPDLDELKAAGLLEKGSSLNVYGTHGDLGEKEELEIQEIDQFVVKNSDTSTENV